MATDWDIIYIVNHAEEIFTSLKWPAGPSCPCCHSHRFLKLKDGRYKCKDCGRIYSLKSNTIFQGSHISIQCWMVALYLMLSGKGISSYELARKLQVTQKTAYYMLMRLRLAFSQDNIIIDGFVVAHDEVYIGGEFKYMSYKKRLAMIEKFHLPPDQLSKGQLVSLGNAINRRNKKPVFGITDGSKCVLKQVPSPIKTEYIVDVYKKHVTRNGVAVSDCCAMYKDWAKITGRPLYKNNHSKHRYVTDNGLSSNMIENVFSWLERTDIFVQVHFDFKYTQLYLDEFAFRYNHRKLSVKDKMIAGIEGCLYEPNRWRLMEFNDLEDKLFIEEDWFNPVKFFKENPKKWVTENEGMVYVRSDFKDELGEQQSSLYIIIYIYQRWPDKASLYVDI